MLAPGDIERLREALAPFTVDAAYERLGAEAHHALMRNESTPAERRTRDEDALATLLRLFSLQLVVHETAAHRALPGLLDPLLAAGILAREGDRVRALVDIRPYGDEVHDWWVVCDLTPTLDGRNTPIASDYVLGVSQASTSLAGLTVREPMGTALDLGTGCGVQSLHLAQHCEHVMATDVNDRALSMARLTAGLNGIDIDVRAGDLFEVAGAATFDLITTNPPYVISPPGSEQLVYRDAGLNGDEVVRRIVTEARQHLNPGGWCQILANWIHPADGSWQERLRDWLRPTGLDAWVVQRERVDPAQYVELWLADAGLSGAPDYTERYDAWLSWMDEYGIAAIGFGWLCLRHAGRDEPVITIDEWSGPVSGPPANDILRWANGNDAISARDVLDDHWRMADDVVLETMRTPGAEHPTSIAVRKLRGLCRTRKLSTLEAGFVDACDGELSAGAIAGALAQLLESDSSQVAGQLRRAVVEMAADGFILPAPEPSGVNGNRLA